MHACIHLCVHVHIHCIHILYVWCMHTCVPVRVWESVCIDMCICLSLCLWMCMPACVSSYICTRMWVNSCMRVWIQVYMCVCVYMHAYMHMHVYVGTCVCMYVGTYMCDYAHTVGWNHRSNFSTSLMGNFCSFLKKSPLCLLLCVWGWPGTHYGAKTALNGLSVSWVPGLQACAVILAKNSVFERRKTSAFRQKEVRLGGVTSGDRRHCVILELPPWGSGLSN